MKKIVNKISIIVISLIILTTFSTCATKAHLFPVDEVIDPPSDPPQWEKIAEGVYQSNFIRENPSLRVWAVKIDLTNPDTRIEMSGPDKNQRLRGLRTSTALENNSWDMAINATPFIPYGYHEGTPMSLVGLGLSRGRLYSGQHPNFSVLLLSPDENGGYTARISEPPVDLQGVETAAGGYFMILDNGKVQIDSPAVRRYGSKRNPYTAVGLGDRILYLMIVDGRQKGWSVGMIPGEAAQWLRYLGARDGMLFDGGGSTTLVMRTKDGPRVVNRPVDGGIIGRERVVANHLGFVFGKSAQ